MKFFKEYDRERQIVPALPTGNGCVKSAQNGSETIHPCICAFYSEPFLIHNFIKEIFFSRLSIAWIWADIGNNPVFVKGLPEGQSVKTCIRIIENAIQCNPTFIKYNESGRFTSSAFKCFP